MTHRNTLLATALALAVVGCVNLDPQTDSTRFYVLSSEDALVRAASSGQDGLVVGIKQLDLSPYLDTRRIVTRVGPNEVSFSEVNRWGEDVKRAAASTLGDYLLGTETVSRVLVVPWTDRVIRAFDVVLRIDRFEGDGGGMTHVLISWEIQDPENGDVLHHGITDDTTSGWTVGDYDDLAARLSASLGVLANDLAAVMAKL